MTTADFNVEKTNIGLQYVIPGTEHASKAEAAHLPDRWRPACHTGGRTLIDVRAFVTIG